MVESSGKSSERLRREWLDHPYFRYRGCAPDVDDPLRMAGDPSLHVGAHHGPDAFAPEGQRERVAREERAIEVCLSCPVMVACDLYASSVTADGRLAEPDGVWGGRRSLERHKALIARRVASVAAPNRAFETVQKQAVLKALAQCWEPFEVAEAAGMDVRTANWQRSSLVRLLGLPKDVSRMRALAVAQERGLLEGVSVVADDGSVPAVPPPTKTTPAPDEPSPESANAEPTDVEPADAGPDTVRGQAAAEGVCRGVRPRRRRVTAVPGQLSLDDALAPAPAAPVRSLFPSHCLEAAA